MARKFPHSFEVCKCKHVSLGEIIHSIKENNATSLERIGELTDAGTCCGCCKDPDSDFGSEKMELYISEILSKIRKDI